MHLLTSHDVTLFLVVIGIMLILARLLFKVGRYFHIPLLVAEVLAGVILGKSVFGRIFPEAFQLFFPSHAALASAYDALYTLSVVMLLFFAGMELDFHLVAKSKKSVFITATLAIIFPLAIGVWAGINYFSFFQGVVVPSAPFAFSFVLATLIALSALSTIARVLLHLKILNSSFGIVIIGSALVTDIVGWFLFSSILTYANPTLANAQILYTLFYILLFLALMFALSSSKNFLRPFFLHSEGKNGEIFYDLSLLFGICLLSGAFTNAINIHPSLGAFVSGILCRRIVGDNSYLLEHLKAFIMNFFAPIFFISIGLKIDLFNEFNISMVLAVFFLASIAKLIGAFLGAFLSGFSARSSLLIGVSLNTRGSMEIIMGSIALKAGLISAELFVSFIMTAIITILIAEPIIQLLLKKIKFS